MINFIIGIGQDSHRFLDEDSTKPCVIAGLIFHGIPGLSADSDGDVVYHSICNAITSITHVPILGKIAPELVKKAGITDSQIYLQKAYQTLSNQEIIHVALTVEGKKPRMQSKVDQMRQNVANVLKIKQSQVGITVTSGDGLTSFGCGEGLQCFCILTVKSVNIA
jgi:2-C-methyl-D-erythritol 2,4-cyclodiphosphate synthase